jgi:hypothetical protein
MADPRLPDSRLLQRAAACYLRAGLVHEAARCYRDGGAYRRAAQTWESIGAYAEAARDYADGGMPELAAWLLAHHLGDVAGARQQLARDPRPADPSADSPADGGRTLRRRLVAARCNAAERVALADVTATLEEAMLRLATGDQLADPLVEPWSVAVAAAMDRADLVASVFAAAVRGRRPNAAQRWAEWSRSVLHVPLVLPAMAADPEPLVGHL